MEPFTCPVCQYIRGTDTASTLLHPPEVSNDVVEINCRRCGRFQILQQAIKMLSVEHARYYGHIWSAVARRAHESGRIEYFTSASLSELAEMPPPYCKLTVPQKIERFLVLLADDEERNPGKGAVYDPFKFAPLLAAKDWEEVRSYRLRLQSEGWTEHRRDGGTYLTWKGWQRVEEIRTRVVLPNEDPVKLPSPHEPSGHKSEQNLGGSEIERPKSHGRDILFVSYSRKDKRHFDRLHVYLKPIEREAKLEVWSDQRISAGSNWREDIVAALARTRVAILLISQDFLASEFIFNAELPMLIEHAERKEVVLIPVYLSHTTFELSKLEPYQGINNPERPLSSCSKSEREQIWTDVVRKARAAYISLIS